MADERNELTASSVERRLRALKPKPSSIDRDRLMYLAGQRSVLSHRQRIDWAWRAVTVVSATAALILAMLLFNGEVSSPTSRDVAQPIPESKDAESTDVERREPVDVRRDADSALVREDDELRERISERGRTMFALRQAISEAGADVLASSPPSAKPESVPSVWDEVRTANLREAMVGRHVREARQSKGLWGIFQLGTKS